VRSALRVRPRPSTSSSMAWRPYLPCCPFCSQQFGTASLAIHVKRCRSRPHKLDAPMLARLSGLLQQNTYDECPVAVSPLQSSSVPNLAPALTEETSEPLCGCRHCGRSFFAHRLAIHEKVCLRRNRPKTGVHARPGRAGTAGLLSSTPRLASRWRQQHAEFLSAVSNSRGGSARARASTPGVPPPLRVQVGSSERLPTASSNPASPSKVATESEAETETGRGSPGRRQNAATRHALEWQAREHHQQHQRSRPALATQSHLYSSLSPGAHPSPVGVPWARDAPASPQGRAHSPQAQQAQPSMNSTHRSAAAASAAAASAAATSAAAASAAAMTSRVAALMPSTSLATTAKHSHGGLAPLPLHATGRAGYPSSCRIWERPTACGMLAASYR